MKSTESNCIDTVKTEIKNESKTKSEKSESKPKRKKIRKNLPGICTINCKYDAIRRCSKSLGFKEMGESDHWTVYWTDCSVSVERCTGMKNFQRINHFPSMTEICRKDLLSRNLTRMLKHYPKEYAFFPRTWVLPADQGDLLTYMRTKKRAAFICKPHQGCQGKGIYITRKPLKATESNEKYIVQQYLDRPLLIDGFKFDLRIYALITSCEPLRIYVYKEGLARFATTQYSGLTNTNMAQSCMHLTNYSINKYSDHFVRDDEEAGSKRKFSSIKKWFIERNYDYDELWRQIDDIIVKTVLSAYPVISHSYRTCFPSHVNHSGSFEILGFDILIDKKLKPWILEVNHSPSFHTDSDLDKEIKEGLIYDTLNMVHVKASDRIQAMSDDKKRTQQRLTKVLKGAQSAEDKKSAQIQEERKTKKINENNEAWELKSSGGFRRIYPTINKEEDKYKKYFENTISLLQTTASAKAREEASKVLRLNLEARNERFKKKSDRGESGTLKPVINKAIRNKSASDIDISEDMKPQRIMASEEMERQRLMKQRHNLFRDLGGIDFVYRILHCTRGTTQHTKPFESGDKQTASLATLGFNMYNGCRQCTDMRCPFKNGTHRESLRSRHGEDHFNGLSRSISAHNGSRVNGQDRPYRLSQGGPPPMLGPTTVLRQRPFCFMKDLSNASALSFLSDAAIRNSKSAKIIKFNK
jgi:tubulin polyglutamylase TTLL6/13